MMMLYVFGVWLILICMKNMQDFLGFFTKEDISLVLQFE